MKILIKIIKNALSRNQFFVVFLHLCFPAVRRSVCQRQYSFVGVMGNKKCMKQNK